MRKGMEERRRERSWIAGVGEVVEGGEGKGRREEVVGF